MGGMCEEESCHAIGDGALIWAVRCSLGGDADDGSWCIDSCSISPGRSATGNLFVREFWDLWQTDCDHIDDSVSFRSALEHAYTLCWLSGGNFGHCQEVET